MNKKYLVWMVVFVFAASIVLAQQATMMSLQGKATDSSGAAINNGNLRVTVSTSDSCEQNIFYDYTYNNLIQKGLFNILLGNDTSLNLIYNQDYFLCTYVNGEIIKNAVGKNTTKFRGGQGQIQPSNITNGTFGNGNFTFANNLTLGAWFFIKNDEDYLYRVIRAPIKFKDLLDRTANENVTGNWTFSGNVTVQGNVTATTFVGDGSGLSNVAGGNDSEWIFVYKRDFSNGGISLGNLSGNFFKVIFLVNNTGAMTLQINNVTTNTYSQRYIETAAPELSQTTSTNIVLTTSSTLGTIYGNFVVYTDYRNNQIRILVNYVDHRDFSQPERSLRTATCCSAPISDIIIGGVSNGTAVVFKHRFLG